MFVFVSILLIVLLAGLAVAYIVTPRTLTWSIIRICVSGALTVAGTVTAIAEPQNIRSFFLEKGGSKTAPYKVAVQFAETAG